MSTFKTRDIAKALGKKGFECRDSHHRMFYFCLDGKRSSINTKISHGASEYSGSLLAMMARPDPGSGLAVSAARSISVDPTAVGGMSAVGSGVIGCSGMSAFSDRSLTCHLVGCG